MRKSKAIENLLKNSSFTTQEAALLGIHRADLSYLCKKGKIERVFRGMYLSKEQPLDIDLQWEDLALAARSIPEGIICLISALAYYDLTDEIMYENWIAVPHKMRAPRRPRTRICRMRNIDYGVETLQLGEFSLKIFNRERSVIDAFRFLDLQTALKALRAYLDNKPNIKNLMHCAKKFRVNISSYVYAYTA